MDRPLQKQFVQKQKLRRLLTAGAVVLAGILMLVFVPRLFSTSFSYTDLSCAKVTAGDLETTVSASGIVVPAYEENIISPIDSRLERMFRNTGDAVNIGDTLLQLDVSVELAGLQRLHDERELKSTRLARFRIETEENEVQYNTTRKIKELEMIGLKADYENEMNIHKIGGSPAEAVEKARTAYEIAKLQLEQINEQNKHKLRMEQSQIREMELEIKLSDASIAEKENTISRACITAENRGVITWLETHIGGNIGKGQQLVRISDISRFKIESSIGDGNSINIRPGIRVIVKSGDHKAFGKVEKVIPSVENAGIRFTVLPDSGDVTSLRLNQKVEIYLVTSFRQNCLLLKNGPYYHEPGEFPLFIVHGNKAVKILVTLGDCNYESVEVISGLKPGDEVIINDMKQFEKLDEIIINH
ncbi:MAG TPA: hypothetical protein DCR43_02640 [Bacteroidales bacterium]|nr:MAG: hypothetical protein A2X11_07250 [Bacteroidetes bacterium GWE2_42_24]OFY29537.1 MAG: hypothetical protein A2X09_04350 [Bacteroidetes bacterium GWF2_43_11]PKP27315.1 MAG: hypothetical protein CVU06_02470 [Bacteroidetes bacterium HGW-Bacteroidetes-22]HAQ64741.1 hypothetical protein [Bacteroidales bacterium]HBZ67339.1 hypothetical protein [Bacteroidales bacterium]